MPIVSAPILRKEAKRSFINNNSQWTGPEILSDTRGNIKKLTIFLRLIKRLTIMLIGFV